jgi:hypothetical protein
MAFMAVTLAREDITAMPMLWSERFNTKIAPEIMTQ